MNLMPSSVRRKTCLDQTALDLDRAENRITFNREQAAQIESRAMRLAIETEQADRQAADLTSRVSGQRESVARLREQNASLEAGLRESTEQASSDVAAQEQLERRIEELRQLAARLVEESAREQAESLQAEDAASRHTAAEEQRATALRAIESECVVLAERVQSFESAFEQSSQHAQELEAWVRASRARIVELRRAQQETSQQLESTREALSGERARRASIEQILSERAYTADAVQKLFSVNGHESAESGASGNGFRAVGLLADYAEVQEQYEAAVEQFLRDELEYVVVESFDHARAGVTLLRDEMGGRATFFVDSLSKLNLPIAESDDAELPVPAGVVARLDRLVDFRDPLGSAAKHFLARLRAAFLVESASVAERMAQEDPRSFFLTLDGTCYHGRMVSGGRQGDAGPLALKRELRQHEAEAARLAPIAQSQQLQLADLENEIEAREKELAVAMSQHVDAEKSLVSATHQRDQARSEFQRIEQQLARENHEITRLHAEAESARARAEQASRQHAAALNSRATAEAGAAEASERLAKLRHDSQVHQERIVARREELATMSERLASATAVELRMSGEIEQANQRLESLRQQHEALLFERRQNSRRPANKLASRWKICGRKNSGSITTRPHWSRNGTRPVRVPPKLMKHCAAAASRSMSFALSAAVTRSKGRATMQTVIIFARPASRN